MDAANVDRDTDEEGQLLIFRDAFDINYLSRIGNCPLLYVVFKSMAELVQAHQAEVV